MKNPADSSQRADKRVNRGHRLQEFVILLGCALVSAAFAMVPEGEDLAPPDFSVLEPDQKKRAFFDYLSPLVTEVNEAARVDRDFVTYVSNQLAAGIRLSRYERDRLAALGERYELSLAEPASAEQIEDLRRRTGTVPASLVLVQAAKESGWGTSRFAIEGRNLFGQRCYEAGCGLQPRERSEEASWGVARFATFRDSLASYVLNLNTHPSYADFRRERQAMRRVQDDLSGLELAGTLDAYSERGADYVEEVRSMIRQNGLE